MDERSNPARGQIVPLPVRGRRIMARLKLQTRVVRAVTIGVVVESPPPRSPSSDR
jgi:hypothetical protein